MLMSSLATRSVRIVGRVAFVLAVLLSPMGVSRAEESPFDTAQTEAIERILRAYLLEHPEIIGEAVGVLQAREEAAKQATMEANLGKLRADVERDPQTPVLGNPDGDVTITEFHDYRCGYCKVAYKPLMKIIKEDGHVRLVLKDLPLLGPDSYVAAKAALAAHAQGKYAAFLNEGMTHRGVFNAEAIEAIAKRIGLDMARFKKEMDSAAIDQQLEKNRFLAQALEIAGTPVFIIGNRMIPGAAGEQHFKELIALARGQR
ncbi:MAG: DSBA oxidoreductase [Rhodospirillaceae bacterium]|nr:MAG: DSBA oxidoreductase [Rhodospirillaceae bacterium]